MGSRDWYMPLHITYHLIMAFNVQENAVFLLDVSKKLSLPWEEEPPPTPSPSRSLRSQFAPPPPVDKILAVSGIPKGHKRPCPLRSSPLLGVKENLKRGYSMGLVYSTSHNLTPLIMAIHVQKMPLSYIKSCLI